MNSSVLRNRDEYKKKIVLEELCRDSQLVKAGKELNAVKKDPST